MRTLRVLLVTLAVTSPGCSRSPLAPLPEGVAILHGWVYERADDGDPPLVDATVELQEPDGTKQVRRTDDDGYYVIAVRRGSVTVTASKEGYEAKTWRFTLSKDTALNFGLEPQ